ncbi:3-phosphoshikimate 1-carboxyvinyltransferase [Microlunatus endophyticus]|uniref:3-phosphoshikimate 1-carboxyvinyltransferase n=1 Tax=Microlunatus endophyticus TaxID=1716077 RepID=A0A917S4Y8_9ACTN|nr:3-phosphoshikimate 1-carboxyvinyltransferase [Microlunatus endophyticus]GGL55930.1 3-phosphoshikimate 1-carboxyvinyltransferase [Microlunatus endophyticus]
MPDSRPWTAPLAPVPVNATVSIPGSKSETNRALILAALADGPSVITGGLDARDTRLMRDGLRALGVVITEHDNRWEITPPSEFSPAAEIDCGLAGTVMRFLPPVAALAAGATTFTGEVAVLDGGEVRVRPMGGLLEGLNAAGAAVEIAANGLPFTITGRPDLPGGEVVVDSSATSQYVSGLLLAGARFAGGLDLRHQGPWVPSRPNIDMTVQMLRDRGVVIEEPEADHWIVHPGTIAAGEFVIEPDLANAAPFLAAAAVTGGRINVPRWPRESNQPGAAITDVLALFGADVSLDGDLLTVQGTDKLEAVDLDLHDASELTMVAAVLAALADHTSRIHGVAHIRGHETDRLAALETDLTAVGAEVRQTDDGLVIHPKLLRSNTWLTYADHRMVTAGALLGLVIDDIQLDDVECVSKTMPDFVDLWTGMLADSVAAEEEAGRA